MGIGRFEPLQADQKLLRPVERVKNVPNISVETGSLLTSGGKQFVPVMFDANILVGPSISNGKVSTLVAGTTQGCVQLTLGAVGSAQDILGTIQQLPNGVPARSAAF
jgi:hypothetical protein